MTRFAWLLVAMAGFLVTFAGCGGSDAPIDDTEDPKDSVNTDKVSDDINKQMDEKGIDSATYGTK